ncbi:inhibitor of growth protein 3 [Procambarus clarkii]|uniref:inhibitor of growth protein 3 n=1 Tax=Procambarus clarkii TaxID=6728 RepID=UPI001E670E08|nr:inhibitor of growth protein 3-like isoform X1 [Procambarus clarkii]
MLYLEDFLEVIEQIPQEIRDRTTDLRELDLGIQNTSDQLEDQIKTFFGNAKKMKPQERDAEYEKIRKEYYKLLDDADEKVNIATNMHDLLERYMRKLDQELEKFKCELEADSPGITEVLEKRSLELDEPIRDNQKENRYVTMNSSSSRNTERRQSSTSSTVSVKKEERTEPNLTSSMSVSPPPASTISYTLGHMGAGSNAIAAAASQAIAATQQMQQGRRTASLKASYDAITSGVQPTEFSIGSELANAAQTALLASALPQETCSNANTSSTSTGSSNKKQKKKHTSVSTVAATTVMEASPAPSEDLLQDALIDPNSENPDWTYDPNEPRYCICNQVSYGDMVACDNPKCPVEWFHYPCVGITAPPKGKWYCPQCAAAMNRRARK